MAENRNPRWRPSAILNFRKSDFWELEPLGLPIFHLSTTFGAQMLIDAKIKAENRNPRWRPSLRANFGEDRSTGATWARAEGIKKKEKKARKETYCGKPVVRPDHPRWRSDIWSCMPGGLREVVIIFKFRQNRLNGFQDVGGRKLAFQAVIIIVMIIIIISSMPHWPLLSPQENASQNELKHDAKRSANRK